MSRAIWSQATAHASPSFAECAWIIDATTDVAAATGLRLVLSTFELEADSAGDSLTVTRTASGEKLQTLTSTATSALPSFADGVAAFKATCDDASGACSLELAGETAVTVALATDMNDNGRQLRGVAGVWYAVSACDTGDTGSLDCALNGGTCSNGGCFAADGSAIDCVCDWDETCAGGKYWDSAVAVCADCPLGRFAAMEGVRYNCTDCAAGKYAKFDGMDHCVTCPEGAYQELEGEETCKACPEGSQRVAQVQTDLGDVIPVLGVSLDQCECMEGYYVLDGTSGKKCEKCPDGATCAGNRSLPYPGEGYWTNTRSAAFLGDHYECPVPELCQGLWHLRSCFTSPQAFDNCDASSINREEDSAFRRLVEVDGEETARRLAESSHQLFNKQMCSNGNLGTLCGVCDVGFTKESGAKAASRARGSWGTRWASSSACSSSSAAGAFGCGGASITRSRARCRLSHLTCTRSSCARTTRCTTPAASRSSGRRTRSFR